MISFFTFQRVTTHSQTLWTEFYGSSPETFMAVVRLADPSFNICNEPLYWFNNDQNYLISTHNNRIQKVNLDIHEIGMINIVKVNNNGQCLDQANNQLYLIGGKYNSFIIFDLKGNTKQILPVKFHKRIDDPICIYIPSPINQLHVFNWTASPQRDHFIYNKTKQEMIKMRDIIPYYIKNPHIIYNTATQKLIMMGSENSGNILYCNIHKDQKEYKWTQPV